MIKKIGIGLFLMILIAVLIYRDLVVYGFRQGAGQMQVIRNSVPINEYLEFNEVPDTIKNKLLFIEEVKNFAVEKIGVNASDNYNSYFDQQGQPILWNVSGSKPFALEAYEWAFPFLGSFSYKGYFNYDLALEEEKKLIDADYDTRVREVNGWSTLGWFNDPVLSNMLTRSEGDLAELIIHELVHGTLYIKDSVDFNENLATFIGHKGAVLFLGEKFGVSSFELKSYLEDEEDLEKYVAHMLRGADSLDSLYSNFEEGIHSDRKKQLKQIQINRIIHTLDSITFNDTTRFRTIFSELPNNAYFMALLRYRSKTNDIEKEWQDNYDSNLKKYLMDLKEKYSSL